jgi:lysophospholipase L1-like esterase
VPHLDTETRGMRVRTNALGMRGAEALPAETPGLVRVVALGDSVTFGYGVDADRSWPAALETLLSSPPLAEGRVTEVLNAGVSGYSTLQEAAALRTKVLPLEPDLVVIGYCLNDPEYLPLQPLHRHFARSAWWHHSALLRTARFRGRNQRIARHGDYWRALHDPEGEDWRSVVRGFTAIAEATQPRGVPVLLVIFPVWKSDDWSAYPYADLHEQVRTAAEASGLAVLDLLEVFAARPPAELFLDEEDIFHPNEAGHALAASAVAGWVREYAEFILNESERSR